MDQESLLIWGLALGSAATVVYLLLRDRSDQVAQRLSKLGDENTLGPGTPSQTARRENLRIGTSQVIQELDQKDSRELLRERVVQAGLYKPQAIALLTTMRVVLCVVPVVIGLAMSTMGLITQTNGLLFGLIAGLVGTIAPSLWLDHLKRTRQSKIRRSLPNALDVIVVCLEAGLSISGSLGVCGELASAHKLLALELGIVEREIQLGATTGTAMRQFAKRFDLEELRSLAAVITQADQFGTSVVKAFRVYADSMRTRRHQRAQELAQKASIKILFPTLLCIFPGIFVVLLGPAAIRIYQGIILGIKTGNL